MIVGTSPNVGKSGHQFLAGVVTVVWVLIAAQFVSGLWKAPASGRSAYLVSAEGLIDLTTVLALPIGWLLTSASSDAQLFVLVWALRYIRHTTGLALFWRIMKRGRVPLGGLSPTLAMRGSRCCKHLPLHPREVDLTW
jgi:hypothetical protein